MPTIDIPTAEITDWPSFHDVFARTLRLPDFYGRNMSAWIDCMSDAQMVGVWPDGDTLLTLQLDDARGFRERCPEQYAAIIECSAFVNHRRTSRGGPATVAIAFAE